MAEPIELEAIEMPMGPRARQLAAQRARIARQRRMRPDGLAPDDTVGAPGLSNPDDRSAIDVRAQTEEELQPVGAPQSSALAQPVPANVQAPPVRRPIDPSAGPVDAALARLNPQQLGRVQALPVSGQYEDDQSNDDAIIGAASREVGTPVPMQTQLRAPMSGPAQHTASTPLRAPGVMDDLAPPDEQAGEDAAAWGQVEDDLLGAPLDEPRPGAMRMMRSTPAQDPQDARDLQQSQRMQRAQRGLAVGSAILSVLSDIGAGPTGNRFSSAPALAGISTGIDANAPIERMNARHASQAQSEQQEFERAMQERRAGLDERRIAQGEAATQQRAGYRDADIVADHPNADNERRLYAASFAALPEHIRRTFPGFDPSSPSVQQNLRGMGAAQVRRALDLLEEQVKIRFPDEQDWSSRVRVGGSRAQRGALPGLGGGSPGRTIRRGDAGVTPEQLMQMDAEGVDEVQTQEAPVQSGGASPARPRPRAQGPRQALQSAPAVEAATTAPAGRPLIDREPTPAELEGMSNDQRATAQLITAVMRANRGMSWREAAATVPNLTPAERSRVLTSYGASTTVEVPGWVRRGNMNIDLQPRELIELRASNAAADRIHSITSRVAQLRARITPADLARNAFTSQDDIQEVMNLARETQALMRDLQHMGVPNGPEMRMVAQQAPEADTPQEWYRLARAYEALWRQAGAANASRMGSYGFVRAGRRPQSGGAR